MSSRPHLVSTSIRTPCKTATPKIHPICNGVEGPTQTTAIAAAGCNWQKNELSLPMSMKNTSTCTSVSTGVSRLQFQLSPTLGTQEPGTAVGDSVAGVPAVDDVGPGVGLAVALVLGDGVLGAGVLWQRSPRWGVTSAQQVRAVR